ncbi:MAG: PIN domain-containing protein [Rothia sp. (in: high G+C Gram-positive bacteria)]|nr:PIN domain-containing protein [Rothia sp. (in: high G+C Gram-positive bacteria)]
MQTSTLNETSGHVGSPLRVFVDANILFSKTLTDWLYFLSQNYRYPVTLLSSEDVFAEVIKNLREKNPYAPGRTITHRLNLLRGCIDDVVADYEVKDHPAVRDVLDLHVHAAAAVESDADILLTANTRDFSADKAPYTLMTPDELFIFFSK